jgi:hypothetical protein
VLRQSPALDCRRPPALPGEPDRTAAPAAVARRRTKAANGLVGREEQLAAFQAALAAWRGRRGRVVLDGGASRGSARRAGRGGRAAGGRQRDHGRLGTLPTRAKAAPPFWPWVQVLRHAARRAGRRSGLQAALGPSAPEVAQLLPELAEVVGARPDRRRSTTWRPSGSGSARRSATCCGAWPAASRCCWSSTTCTGRDVGSLLLLPILAGDLSGARLLVVATYRDVGAGALAGRHARRAGAAGAGRPDGARRAGPRRGPRGWIAAELGAEPDQRLARLVHDRTEGNPSSRRGAGAPARQRRPARRLGGPRRRRWRPWEVPAGVRDVAPAAVGGPVPEQTNAVLLVAAVAGRRFDLDTVQARHRGLDDDGALEAVEAALLSGPGGRGGRAGRAASGSPTPWSGGHLRGGEQGAPGTAAARPRRQALLERQPGDDARPAAGTRPPLVAGGTGGRCRRGPAPVVAAADLAMDRLATRRPSGSSAGRSSCCRRCHRRPSAPGPSLTRS